MGFPGPDAFDGGPHRHRLGLRSIDESAWLDVDGHFAEQVTLKRRLLEEVPDRVVVRLGGPDDEEAAVALLETIETALRRYHPDAWESVAGRADDRWPAIARCGLLTQEDWVVLVPRDGALVVGAGTVSFPTRWDLPSKLGRSVVDVHAPVEGYAEEVGDRVDAYLGALRPDRIGVRLNWNIVDEERLHQPTATWRGPGPNPAVTADNAGTHLWLRVERETLRRIGAAVVFGIRVHTQTLDEVALDPARLDRLVASVRHLPPETAVYKGVPAFESAFLGWAVSRGVDVDKVHLDSGPPRR